jgi:N-acetylmuramic acid 6-phosphate etherase
MVQAIMAGGPQSVFRSREGAEDDRDAAWRAVGRSVRPGDAVVGIAASGVTPFVESALASARRQGASTILLTCNRSASAVRTAQVVIAPSVGPEIIAGSTRLKAGTATKLILNMLTVGTMVRLGKVHGNLMVDARPTSAKLRARALRLIQTIAGVTEAEAARCLQASGGQTKTAIVMAARRLNAPSARALLQQHDGFLSSILSK